MKWLVILLVVVVTFVVLWKAGYLEEFFKPWAGWAKFIGYFQ